MTKEEFLQQAKIAIGSRRVLFAEHKPGVGLYVASGALIGYEDRDLVVGVQPDGQVTSWIHVKDVRQPEYEVPTEN
jgi:hypothetical protein